MDDATPLRDDQPSPWVCCPECGNIWLTLVAALERGRWIETYAGDDEYVVDDDADVRVSTFRSGAQSIGCGVCGNHFSLDQALGREPWEQQLPRAGG